jgi:hypothetical protein
MTNEKEIIDFASRLRCIIGKSGDTKKVFAERCGTSEKQLYIYLKGASEPGMKFFRNMKEQYSKFNIEWLISGEGEPILKESPKDVPQGNVIDSKHADVIKRFIDKPYARELNMNLVELERLCPDGYLKVGTFVKGMLEGVQSMAAEPTPSYGERRKKEAPDQIPPGGDRRQGPDRRKAGGG